MSVRPLLCTCALISALVIGSGTTAAQTADTGRTSLRLFGGAFAGMNMHSGDFSALPGVPNCCVSFSSGSGFGLTINAGIETQLSAGLFDRPMYVGIAASYQMLSGTFTESEFVGNIINGSTVTQGLVEHELDASYGVIGIEPYVSLPILPSIPLSAHIGVLAGIPLGASYAQKQALTSPSDPGYTFENGSRERNISEGALPDASGLYAGIVLGLSYEINLGDGLTVSPEIRYQLGLTNVVSSVPWTISTFRGGATVQYRLPKSEPPPPPPPPPAPEPPPPPPPPPVIAELRSQVRIEGRSAQGDTIDVAAINEVVATVSYEAAPVLFFEKNSTIPVASSSQLGMYQQNVLTAVRSYMQSHPNDRITIIGSSASDEAAPLARERVSWVVRELGLIDARMTVRTERATEAKYPELLDEQRSVSFLINDRAMVIPVIQRDTTRSASDIILPVAHLVTCEAGPCATQLRARFAGTDLSVQGSGPVYSVVLPQRLLLTEGQTEVLEAQGTAKDTTGRIASSNDVVIIAPRVKSRSEVRTTVTPQRLEGEPILLGHFAFDGTTFITTNTDGVAEVRKALKDGKKVSLLASADNCGLADYNADLVQRRARAAVELLGVREQDVFITTICTTAEANTTPMDRVSNRSVRAIIR
ncbi:MAG: hypothetical protein KA339_00540 [Candidatus Kapabacteria bacterium]|nr:hypothetical protein [Candidatus Kapabacteria bacterium]